MRTFFSVDVETSNLSPWLSDGFLLTIGVVARRIQLSGASHPVSGGEFYVRLEHYDELDPWWWSGDVSEAPSETAAWWMDQSDLAQQEAWLDTDLVRLYPELAARMLSEFVIGLAPEPEDRVFVANPVAFDKMWIDSLFGQTGVENPFHYRSLCLRSMRFGVEARSEWGASRSDCEPVIPHHALHDARAQALDFDSLIYARNCKGDS